MCLGLYGFLFLCRNGADNCSGCAGKDGSSDVCAGSGVYRLFLNVLDGRDTEALKNEVVVLSRLISACGETGNKEYLLALFEIYGV